MTPEVVADAEGDGAFFYHSVVHNLYDGGVKTSRDSLHGDEEALFLLDDDFGDGTEALDEVEFRRNGHADTDGVGDDALLVGGAGAYAVDDAG